MNLAGWGNCVVVSQSGGKMRSSGFAKLSFVMVTV